MKCRILCIFFFPWLALAQTQINGSRVVEGDLTVKGLLSAAGMTATIQAAESLPGTCSANQVAIRTSDNTLHFCASPNVWTQLGGSSGGSSAVTEEIYLMAGWRNGGYYENAAPWQAEAATASPAAVRSSDGRLTGLQFEEATVDEAVFHHRLPGTWTGAADTAITLHWYGADNNTLSTAWQVETHCNDEIENIGYVPWTWNDEGVVADANVRYAWNPVTFSPVSLAGCDPGDLLSVRVRRLGADAADAYASNVTLLDAVLKYVRTAQ